MSKEDNASENGIKEIEEVIEHIQLLLDVACQKLDDLRKAVTDPKYFKSVLKTKEKELSAKMADILKGYAEIKRIQNRNHRD